GRGIVALHTIVVALRRPPAAVDVEHEAKAILVGASAQSYVYPPDGRSVAIDQGPQRLAAEIDFCGLHRQPPVPDRESKGGVQLEPLSLALFFIGDDPITTPGSDVLQPEEVVERSAER